MGRAVSAHAVPRSRTCLLFASLTYRRRPSHAVKTKQGAHKKSGRSRHSLPTQGVDAWLTSATLQLLSQAVAATILSVTCAAPQPRPWVRRALAQAGTAATMSLHTGARETVTGAHHREGVIAAARAGHLVAVPVPRSRRRDAVLARARRVHANRGVRRRRDARHELRARHFPARIDGLRDRVVDGVPGLPHARVTGRRATRGRAGPTPPPYPTDRPSARRRSGAHVTMNATTVPRNSAICAGRVAPC